ncbi:hypothetical protein C8J56DRAFT_466705 [Mycena floridula]|nr:hypothetical protein C8J56DRAFT_466705 [Mycena floridula]
MHGLWSNIRSQFSRNGQPTMRLSTLLFVSLFFYTSHADLASSKRSTVGAVYFISNQPDKNYVVASAISADGKLTVGKATYAGGAGSHQAVLTAGDAFFSQGSVAVSQDHRLLATINAGSNTVVLFDIDSTDPTKLTMLGKPISTKGEFPVSVTINPNGDGVCVLNGGKVNGVSCYKIIPKYGLVPSTVRSLGLNQTTPPAAAPGTASDILFSPDGKSLYAAVKGTDNTTHAGFIAIWDVLYGGSISDKFKTRVVPHGGATPFSMTPIAGKPGALFLADTNQGYDVVDLESGFGQAEVAAPGGNCWSAYSQRTGKYFLSAPGAGTITEVNIGPDLKSSVGKQHILNGGPLDIAAASNGFLYVLTAANRSVTVLDLTDNSGVVQTLDISEEKTGVPIGASLSFLQLSVLTSRTESANLAGMAAYMK